ncbi:MAG TPA: DUF1385 domain-containing protein [Gaiellaceae bacterium]|nr:DUF1385 domain-containing protein [Gaiellaceae bacterium]
MARPHGVVIVSERYWAFAQCDGTLSEGRMPSSETRWRRIPLIRGLARLSTSLSPLFRKTGVARDRDRAILGGALVLPFGFVFLPETVGLAIGFALTTILLLAWLFRGRTLSLHGAEHRAIAAAEERRLCSTWTGEVRPSRFSRRCGTNFAALVLPVTFVGERLWPLTPAFYTPVVLTLVALAFSMELWLVLQALPRRLASLFLLPGLSLQRLTTREPTLEETRVALRAVDAVLRRELDLLAR